MSYLYIGLFLIILYMLYHKQRHYINECMLVEAKNTWVQPWNLSSRHTRNMSYDLRGEVENPYFYTGPFNNSSLI